jgi:hypothetical protein
MHAPKAAMPSSPLGKNDPAQRPGESAVKRGGGPKTTKGKAASRRNGLKLGLAASTLRLPNVRQPGRFELCQQELQRDYPAASTLEKILLAETARQSAALRLGQKAAVSTSRAIRGASFARFPHAANEIDEAVKSMQPHHIIMPGFSLKFSSLEGFVHRLGAERHATGSQRIKPPPSVT